MGEKRKQLLQSSQPEEPPLKQPHQQQPPQFDLEEEYEEVKEEVEEEEVEEEEVEEEEEAKLDGGEEGEDKNITNNANDQTAKAPSTSSPGDDGGDDPIQKILEPFGKDQIVNLLCEAATKHRDVADLIRSVADADPAHRKIFVHGLGWDTTADKLSAAFRQYGEIEECKAVCDKFSGKSKGYGFILFKTRRGAREALKEPQKRIGKRITACQLASIGPVTTNGLPHAQPGPPVASESAQRKIYVSNVGPELDPQRLLSFFSRFGEIEEGPLGLDKATGKPRGYCLFVYKSGESMKKALEEPHKDFEGHVLHCQKAIDGSKVGKWQQRQQRTMTRLQRNTNNNGGFVGSVAAAPGHLMAPAGPAIGYNQAIVAAPPVNPAFGQALTALLTPPGASIKLNSLLGALGMQAGVNSAAAAAAASLAMQGGTGYNGQQTGYGNQLGLQSVYQNQQVGQASGGSGRGQQQKYGGVAPYMGN